MEGKYMSTEQVARLYEVQGQTVRTWIEKGLLPDSVMLAGRWFVLRESLKNFKKPQAGRPPKAP